MGFDVATKLALGLSVCGETIVVGHQRREVQLQRAADRMRRAAGVATDEHPARGAAGNRKARTLVVVRRAVGLPTCAAAARGVAGGLFESGQEEFEFAWHFGFSMRFL
jgi:hypothetical protein